MVYKKYIKRDGKVYGPYLYHNTKKNGRVITTYHGKHKGKGKNFFNLKDPKKFVLIISFLGILIAALLINLFFILDNSFTGKVSLDVQNVYLSGDNITGNLRLVLRHGEFFPAESKVVIDNVGETYEFNLEELAQDQSNIGDFYIENELISGFGRGYGFSGERIIYPEVKFSFRVVGGEGVSSDSLDSQEVSEPEQTSSEEEIPDSSEEIPEETDSDAPIDDTSEETISEEKTPSDQVEGDEDVSETQDSSSAQGDETTSESGVGFESDSMDGSSESSTTESSTESSSESDSSTESTSSDSSESSSSDSLAITGEVVGEEGNLIDAVVSKDNPFVYEVASGEDVEIVYETASVSVSREGDIFTFTTEYSEVEEGFGEDYLTDELYFVPINLDSLDLVAKEGDLRIDFVYGGDVLISGEIPIMVEEESLLDVPSEVGIIPTNETKNETNLTRSEEIDGKILNKNLKVSNDVVDELKVRDGVRVIIKKNSGKSIGKNLQGLEDSFESLILDSADLDLLDSEIIDNIVLDNPVELFVNESDSIIRSYNVRDNFGLSGSGINVCVLDSGVDSGVVSYTTGFDFVNNDSDASDDNGHGTQVANILKSIAPEVNLFVAKVVDSNGIGYESDVLEGLSWCESNGAEIVSLSIGSGLSSGICDSNIVSEFSNGLVSNGIFVVGATGNDGSSSTAVPSCASGVVSVGATTKQDSIATFSNVNEGVDLFAPGVGVETLSIGGVSSTMSGTSASVPMVSAGAAIVLENESLTPSVLRNRLKTTGKGIDYSGNSISRIDVYNAIINNVTGEIQNVTLNETNVTEGNFSVLDSVYTVDLADQQFPSSWTQYGSAFSVVEEYISGAYIRMNFYGASSTTVFLAVVPSSSACSAATSVYSYTGPTLGYTTSAWFSTNDVSGPGDYKFCIYKSGGGTPLIAWTQLNITGSTCDQASATCTSDLYCSSSYEWLSGGTGGALSYCCGDDSGETWDTSGSANGCCCGADTIGDNGYSEYCSSNSNWCNYTSGGYDCASQDVYFLGQDSSSPLVCAGCGLGQQSQNYACSNDADSDIEGICGFSSATYDYRCVGPSAFLSGGNYLDLASANLVENVYVCDDDVTDGNGFSQAGLVARDTGSSQNVCDVSGDICYDGENSQYRSDCSQCSVAYASDASGDACDIDVTDSSYTVGGICTGSGCSSGTVRKDVSSGNFESGCDLSGDACDNNVNGGSFSCTGLCASNTCVGTMVVEDSGNYYNSCVGRDGASCDNDVTPSAGQCEFSQAGTCCGGACASPGNVPEGGQCCGSDAACNDAINQLSCSPTTGTCLRDDGELCSSDSQCVGYCDADLSGTSRCHSTQTSCVEDASGAETPTGNTACFAGTATKTCSNGNWGPATTCESSNSCSNMYQILDKAGTCSAGVCDSGTTSYVNVGDVCQNGLSVNPSAAIACGASGLEACYCDTYYDCHADTCSADIYYAGYNNGPSCTTTGWVDSGNNFNAPDNQIIASNVPTTFGCGLVSTGGTPSYDSCLNRYTRQGPDGYCDGSGSWDTDDAQLHVTEGDVCQNGNNVNPSYSFTCGAGSSEACYCDNDWYQCDSVNDCTYDQYLVGYASSGSACTSTGQVLRASDVPTSDEYRCSISSSNAFSNVAYGMDTSACNTAYSCTSLENTNAAYDSGYGYYTQAFCGGGSCTRTGSDIVGDGDTSADACECKIDLVQGTCDDGESSCWENIGSTYECCLPGEFVCEGTDAACVDGTYRTDENSYETVCDCNVDSASCDGGTCFNDTGGIIFGENTLGSCCGNDANEYYNSSVLEGINYNGCCDSSTDCVASDGCYNTGQSTFLGIDEYVCENTQWLEKVQYNTCFPTYDKAILRINETLNCNPANSPVGGLKVEELVVESGGFLTLDRISFFTDKTTIEGAGSLSIAHSRSSIWQNGELVISGEYEIDNSTLHMNGTNDGDFGIKVNGTGNLKIKGNSLITNGEDTSFNYYFNVESGTIFNMTDSALSYAGWTDSSGGSGLEIFANNVVVKNNTFSNNYRSLVLGGTGAFVDGNNFSSVGSSYGHGIYVLADSQTIFNNSLSVTGDNSAGIFLFQSDGHNVTSNAVTHSGVNYGALRVQDSSSNTVEGNVLTTSGSNGRALVLLGPASSNVFNNNNFSAVDYGVYLNGAVNSNNFSGNTFYGSTSLAMYAASSQVLSGNLFYDSVFPSTTNEISVQSDSGFKVYDNFFINTSIDTSGISVSQVGDNVLLGWYVNVNVTDGVNAIEDADVYLYDVDSLLRKQDTTAISGLTSTLDVPMEVYTSAGKNSLNNYTVNVSKMFYDNVSVSTNITGNSVVDVQLIASLTSCRELNESKTYKLFNDVSSAQTCFNVSADNVVLDCQGRSITYGTGGVSDSHGFNTMMENTTIKNCNLIEGSGAGDSKFAIYYDGAITGDILNNTISVFGARGYGIYLDYADGNYVVNNTISSTSGNRGYGLYLYYADNNVVEGNEITTTGEDVYGIYSQQSVGGEFYDNSISSNLATSFFLEGLIPSAYQILSSGNTVNGKPLYYSHGVNSLSVPSGDYGEVIISGSSGVTLDGVNTSEHGIFLYYVDNSDIINSQIGSVGDALVVYEGTMNSFDNLDISVDRGHASLFISSTGNSYSSVSSSITTNGHGIYLEGADFNNFTNVVVNNLGTSSAAGIYFTENPDFGDVSSNNMFDNVHVSTVGTSSSGALVAWRESIDNNTFVDSELDASNTQDIYIGNYVDVAGTIYFYNTTFDKNDVFFSSGATNAVLSVNWYLDVNVTNSSGPLSGVGVSGADSVGIPIFDEITDLSGFIPQQSLLEYVQTSTGKTFEGLYGVNSSYPPYAPYQNHSVNMSKSIQLDIIFDNVLPTVELISPEDMNTTLNATPTFVWNGTDPDGDSMTYQFNITLYSDGPGPSCSDTRSLVDTDSLENYTILPELYCYSDDNYYYNWTARASDDGGVSWGEWAIPRRIEVQSLVSINLTNSQIDFGLISSGEMNDTLDGIPQPFVIENNGNVYVNVSVNATNLWTQDPNPTNRFMFKIDNVTGEEGSFDWVSSLNSWTSLPLAGTSLGSIFNFDWDDASDSAEVDINITVPDFEGAGEKSSMIIFTANRQ